MLLSKNTAWSKKPERIIRNPIISINLIVGRISKSHLRSGYYHCCQWNHRFLGIRCKAAPICFNEVCQASADREFLLSLIFPLLGAAAAFVAVRYAREAERRESTLIESKETGVVFSAPSGTEPDRDALGELVMRPISYTPWPIEAGAPGERVRIPVGPLGQCEPRTYVFERLLPSPSEIVVLNLTRPLGLVFEYDPVKKRARVANLVGGSEAERQRKVSALSPGPPSQSAALPGDLLRGVTATTPVYSTKALFGAGLPETHVVLYGVDGQSWASIKAALKQGNTREREVCLVLERAKS